MIDELPWAAFAHPERATAHDVRVTALQPGLKEAMQPCVGAVSPGANVETRTIHQAAAAAFLYLLLSLQSPGQSACVYTLRSTIPIASGLGSSASISVCISTALLAQINKLEAPGGPRPDRMLEIINYWAFVGELCIHGNPSGVDNTVATRGKAVVFKKADLRQPPSVTPITAFPVLPLLLVDTKQARSTATEVGKVAALKTAHPVVTNMLLDSIDKITEAAHALLTSDGFQADDPQALQRLGELMRMNHGILVSLGVSHPRLERIREIVDHAGIGWTKLTGAGGGGCAITVLKPAMHSDELHNVEQMLEAEGFSRYETLLGGHGVGILRTIGSITQGAFQSAKGSDAVEEMVGIGSTQSHQWRYWD